MSFKVIIKYLTAFCVGVVVTLFAQKALKNLINYKTDESRVMLASLGEKILEFKRTCGRLPSTDRGLKALVDPSIEGRTASPFLPLVPLDPWDGQIKYIVSGSEAFLLPSNPEGSFVKIEP